MLGATLTFPGATAKEPNPLFRALKNFFDGIRDGRNAYARYQELSALNDNELKAMGLSRRDIGRAAMFPTGKSAA